ncbi:MAG: hypothetical protein Fur0046_28150 [Cyanobacteria bacterium J069]|nr:MAG: DDE transposase family protein [Cyanobacteria bacterium J069]
MHESAGSNETTGWYIVKQPEGHCDIFPASALSSSQPDQSPSTENPQAAKVAEAQQWGPFESQSEAIARRVGLIRAGKCLPR